MSPDTNRTSGRVFRKIGVGLLVAAFWIAVWEALSRLVAAELLLPSPWQVAVTGWNLVQTATFWRATGLSLLRIVIGSLLGGGPTVMAYSLAGGLLSFGGMAALKQGCKFSVIGVSLAGGFLHNLGQLFIAAWAVESMGIFSYLPILGLCGLVTGAVIGILAAMALPRLSFLPVPR